MKSILENNRAKKEHYKFDDEAPVNQESVLKELRLMRRAVNAFTKTQRFRYRFLAGVVGGLGTVLGATVVVALLVFILRSFASVEMLKPLVNGIIDIINSRQ